ncbi:MAG: BolA family transcriptional regulator [Gammaproteobacteria bacterium]|nr:BolA family transcriptional regulator [Gammaproteobacteria bacterium]
MRNVMEASMQKVIEKKLADSLTPEFLQVENESAQHAGHAHGGLDSHFKVTIACADFANLSSVARHQRVYKILAEELTGSLHALVIKAFSAEEWNNQQKN